MKANRPDDPGATASGVTLSQRFLIRNISGIERALERAIGIELSRLTKHMTFLATTASACPFIGLFGTVWGIMQAFRAIGPPGSTSILAVAPGISEALVNTAASSPRPFPPSFLQLLHGEVGSTGRKEASPWSHHLAERNFT